MSEKNRSIGKYRQYYVFLWFLLLASILWFFNKYTQDYTVVLPFSPKLKNTANSSTYTDLGDNTLSVQLRASGFFILREKLSRSQLNIDMSDLKAPEINTTLHLPTSLIKDRFSDYIGRSVQVISIEPDTILFNVRHSKKIKVPVIAKLDLTLMDEYRRSGPVELSPDSVIVSGDELLLNKLQEINVTISRKDILKENIEGVIMLQEQNLTISPKKIKYHIPIERCTQYICKIPIKVNKLPEGEKIIIIPQEAEIRCSVPLKDYNTLNPGKFEISIDYNDIMNSRNRKVNTKLSKFPDKTFEFNIQPTTVEVLVQK